jgi:hypothetical protein
MAVANRDGRLTMSAAVAATGANRNTIKSILRKLVAGQRLTRHGRGRGSWYRPGRSLSPPPLPALRG